MLKRRIVTGLLLVCMLVGAAVLTKLSLHDSGTVSVSMVEDMEKIPFVFLGVFDNDWKDVGERIFQEASAADNVLVVRPTGRTELNYYAVLQEVEVKQTIRSKEALPEKIWIEMDNGFFYSPENYGNTLVNWSFQNIMYSDWEYLVFLNEYDYAPDIYYNKLFAGAVRVSEDLEYQVIDTRQVYTYGELKSCEFFADSEEMLDILYGIKEELLSSYM